MAKRSFPKGIPGRGGRITYQREGGQTLIVSVEHRKLSEDGTCRVHLRDTSRLLEYDPSTKEWSEFFTNTDGPMKNMGKVQLI